MDNTINCGPIVLRTSFVLNSVAILSSRKWPILVSAVLRPLSTPIIEATTPGSIASPIVLPLSLFPLSFVSLLATFNISSTMRQPYAPLVTY